MINISKKASFLAGGALIASLSLGSLHASASSNDILFILDGSGSMWGQIDGVAKIETAKGTLSKLMDEVPAGSRLGFMTYGTKSKSSCSDVSIMNQIGSDRGAIKNNIQGLRPLGKTPIQKSLIDGLNVLANAEPSDVQKSLVLISDGIETCDGDPCAVAASASQRGINMQVHVVGFDVDADARSQLECIAKAGGGQYFNASDTEGFRLAMNKVIEVAQTAPTPPPKPAPEPEPIVAEKPKGPSVTEFFREDFNGTELSENWAIENADPESFVLENGKLVMLSTAMNRFSSEKPVNLISYTGEMPKGDWDAEITFTAQMPTRGGIYFGLRKDKDNYIEAPFWRQHYGSCQSVRTSLDKMAGGKKDGVGYLFRGNIGLCNGKQPEIGVERDFKVIAADLETKPVTLTVSKRGRSYFAKTKQEGIKFKDGTPYEPKTSEYTSLRSPGTLSFTIGRYNKDMQGELFFEIDSVVINKVEE